MADIPLEISRDSVEQRNVLVKAIVQAILPFKDRIPPDVAIIALARCITVLMTKLPGQAKTDMQQVLRAYIDGRADFVEGQPDDRAGSLIQLVK